MKKKNNKVEQIRGHLQERQRGVSPGQLIDSVDTSRDKIEEIVVVTIDSQGRIGSGYSVENAMNAIAMLEMAKQQIMDDIYG